MFCLSFYLNWKLPVQFTKALINEVQINTVPSGFRGGGREVGRPYSSGIRPSKGQSLVLFSDIRFWLTDHKIVLKVPSEPKNINFEG